ncbi:hypothetical protein P7K49_027320 [Saguinus oedipus]|uniref:Uncharacterized protein n=1 Tax=Saguinus oedipus TaxID=9490 RepID=A0ABQ9U960_SAGOE|nr:hypothetical protein P7K49_027320 [Saguinus oedipus]
MQAWAPAPSPKGDAQGSVARGDIALQMEKHALLSEESKCHVAEPELHSPGPGSSGNPNSLLSFPRTFRLARFTRQLLRVCLTREADTLLDV